MVAAEVLAPLLQHQSVCFWTDNVGAVGDIKSKAPKLWRTDLQYLIRRLAQLAVDNQFMFYVREIEGDKNGLADALSRDYELEEYMSQFQIETWQKHSISKIVESIFIDLIKEPKNGKLNKLEPRNLEWHSLSRNPMSPRYDVNEKIEYWDELEDGESETISDINSDDESVDSDELETIYV